MCFILKEGDISVQDIGKNQFSHTALYLSCMAGVIFMGVKVRWPGATANTVTALETVAASGAAKLSAGRLKGFLLTGKSWTWSKDVPVRTLPNAATRTLHWS